MPKKKKRKKKKWKKIPFKKRLKIKEEAKAKRRQDALEYTVRKLVPLNHIVTLSPTRFTTEAINECMHAFTKMYGRRFKASDKGKSSAEHLLDVISSAFEHTHGGVRLAKYMFFIPGSTTHKLDIEKMNSMFRSWHVLSVSVPIAQSTQYEDVFIQRIDQEQMDFHQRAGAHQVTKYTTSLAALWFKKKLVWMRTIANAMGSQKAHKRIERLAKLRDDYCEKHGYNLPMHAEVQRVLAESYDLEWQEREVMKWINWRNDDAPILQMIEGTIAQDRLERHSLRLVKAMRAHFDDPRNEEVERDMLDKKAAVLWNADRWILPKQKHQQHPIRKEDDPF
jgi:hypothetical protein